MHVNVENVTESQLKAKPSCLQPQATCKGSWPAPRRNASLFGHLWFCSQLPPDVASDCWFEPSSESPWDHRLAVACSLGHVERSPAVAMETEVTLQPSQGRPLFFASARFEWPTNLICPFKIVALVFKWVCVSLGWPQNGGFPFRFPFKITNIGGTSSKKETSHPNQCGCGSKHVPKYGTLVIGTKD